MVKTWCCRGNVMVTSIRRQKHAGEDVSRLACEAGVVFAWSDHALRSSGMLDCWDRDYVGGGVP